MQAAVHAPAGRKTVAVLGFSATERAERTLPAFRSTTCPGVGVTARSLGVPRSGGHFVSQKPPFRFPSVSWLWTVSSTPPQGTTCRCLSAIRAYFFLHYGDTMRNTLKTHRFTVRLSEDDVNNLQTIAAREGFSPSAIVRHLIVRFLDNRLSMGGGHATT